MDHSSVYLTGRMLLSALLSGREKLHPARQPVGSADFSALPAVASRERAPSLCRPCVRVRSCQPSLVLSHLPWPSACENSLLARRRASINLSTESAAFMPG